MSFLGGGGPSRIRPVQPPPRPVDVDLGARQGERARLRRARGTSTLLSRGLLGTEPETLFPRLGGTLG